VLAAHGFEEIACFKRNVGEAVPTRVEFRGADCRWVYVDGVHLFAERSEQGCEKAAAGADVERVLRDGRRVMRWGDFERRG